MSLFGSWWSMKSLIIANATPSALSHPLRKQFIKTIDPDTRNSLAVPSSRESVGSIIPSFLRCSCQHRGSVTLDMSNQTFGSYWLFPVPPWCSKATFVLSIFTAGKDSILILDLHPTQRTCCYLGINSSCYPHPLGQPITSPRWDG